MNLLFLVNGNSSNIFKAHNLNPEVFEIVKIDEKVLAKPRSILEYTRKKFESIYFGCISIDFQRFIPFMLIYILLSKCKKGGVIDEDGKKIRFSIPKTIFFTIPMLIFEFIASIFIVIFSYVYYFVWWKFKTKN